MFTNVIASGAATTKHHRVAGKTSRTASLGGLSPGLFYGIMRAMPVGEVITKLSARSKLKLPLILTCLALLLLFLYPLPAQGQGVGGYVQVNAFERKVTPDKVFKGEKLQGLLRLDATLVKELPVNTNVEVEYEVRAKLDASQPGEIVGKGTLKLGPLPSVTPGANVNVNETIDLVFPDSARPGQYTLIIEATSIKPFLIAMLANLVFPGLKSFSGTLGQVQYLGEKPLTDGNIKLKIYAPKEALATSPIDGEVEVHVPNAQKVAVALYLQKGTEKIPIKELTMSGDDRIKESIPTPDYDGNIRLVAEVKSYFIEGRQVNLAIPLVASADVALKRRPLQAEGKVDDRGVVKQGFQVASQDNKATVVLPASTKALIGDRQPISDLTVVGEPPPPTGQGYLIIGMAYRFLPEDATFEPPVRVSIGYDRATLPQNVKEAKLAIAYFTAANGWIKLPSKLDQEKQALTAEVGHFSLLALMGETTRPNFWLFAVIGVATGALVTVALFLWLAPMHRGR